MANLTKYTRECIVRKIMADIPVRDFAAEADALVQPVAIARLPVQVQRLWSSNDLRAFVRTTTVSTDCGALRVLIPSCTSGYLSKDERIEAIGADCWAAFQALCGEYSKERESRKSIARQLDANFSNIRSDKMFRERFPEFAQYLPERVSPIANLPATTALIDTLRASGWSAPEAAQVPA